MPVLLKRAIMPRSSCWRLWQWNMYAPWEGPVLWGRESERRDGKAERVREKDEREGCEGGVGGRGKRIT
jgi:hypothetical protein